MAAIAAVAAEHTMRTPSGGGREKVFAIPTTSSTLAPPASDRLARAVQRASSSPGRLAGEVELDELLFAALALLALYCLIALRRTRRARFDTGTGGSTTTAVTVAATEPTGGGKNARGATQQQIESNLAHTTVTLYGGAASAVSASSREDVAFDQEQCAICLDLLRRATSPDMRNDVRILPCAHAFHAGACEDSVMRCVRILTRCVACIDLWLLRCTQCPCCLKQPW